MSAIPLRDYVVPGLVSAETVNALFAFGEPMLTESIGGGARCADIHRHFRAWVRYRPGCDWPFNNSARVMGHPWHSTPQFAATALLEKLRRAKE